MKKHLRSLNISGALAALAAALALAAPHASLPARAADTSVSRSMVDFSFTQAADQFYKHVGDQAILDGAVNGLRAIAKRFGDNPNRVAPVRPTGGEAADVAALNHSLALAGKVYKNVPERELAYGAIAGMMDALHDRWSVFLTPKEFRQLNEGLDGGNFPGIGVVIDIDPASKALLVQQVLDGGPAAKAGLLPGDIIVMVDGKSTKGLTTEQDSAMIRGKAGTTVHLVVQRQGQSQPISFDIVRAVIHTPSVLGRLVNNDIGYIQVFVFGLTTGDELGATLSRLHKAGAKGYILDLRNNGGGYLNAAIDVSSKFIAEGPIVSIDSRTKPLTTFDAENQAIPPAPLAVLVNQFTASASEITSGAIQESGAGVLIGTKTFGKGVVQTIYPLPDGSAIKITTARYLTPKGHDINDVGIEPDILVPNVPPSALGNLALDSQLKRAIGYVQDRIAEDLPASGPTSNSSGSSR